MLMIYFFFSCRCCVWHLWTATDWKNPPLFPPWLLSGTVSSELRYFWHIAGATVGFLDDQHFRQILLDILLTVWSDKRERQKDNKISFKKKTAWWGGFWATYLQTPSTHFDSRTNPFPAVLFDQPNLVMTLMSLYARNSIYCVEVAVFWLHESFQHWSNSGDRCAKWGVTSPIIQKWRGLTFHPRQSL